METRVIRCMVSGCAATETLENLNPDHEHFTVRAQTDMRLWELGWNISERYECPECAAELDA